MKEDVTNNILTSGLNKDDNPASLEKGEYTYALNAAITKEGNNSLLQNYYGNELCVNLPYGYMLIYSKLINNGDQVLFLVDPISIDGLGRCKSQIGILSQDCVYTKYVEDYCLNFRIDKPIKASFKEVYNCGRVIYWTDNFNPRRFLNLDKIPYLQIGGDDCNPVYGSEVDCDKLLIDKNIKVPCITFSQILNSGGELFTGSYQIAIQYADINGVGYTDYFGLTDICPIVRDALYTSFETIWGNPANTPTSKAIEITLSNLDNVFEAYNLAVIKTINGVQSAQIVATLPISQDLYIYTGASIKDITVDEIVSKNTIYDKFKTLDDSNGYLLWGNMSLDNQYNYQPYANKIQVQWQTYRVNANNLHKEYKDGLSTTYRKSLMRDEIYALGIYFTYLNGTESCVYSIPGREINKKINGNIITNQYDQYSNLSNPSSAKWDETFTAAGDDNYSNESSRWKIYNTATIEGNDSLDSNGEGWYQYGEMSYVESEYTYPNNKDVWGDLCGKPIRHHKMPDCSITHIHTAQTDYLPLHGAPGNEDDFNVNITKNVFLDLLGIRVSNIEIPVDLQQKIQGWKIVAADRKGNKTIIAKGLAFNCRQEDPTNHEDHASIRYFPNYPYNYITNDNFPSTPTHTDPYYDSGSLESTFNFNNVFTFHSPETSFQNTLLNVSEFKRERYEIGSGRKYIEKCKDWDQLTGNGNNYEILIDEGYGLYNNHQISEYLHIRRQLKDAKYANANSLVSKGALDHDLNNYHRESSVFLGVNQPNYSFNYYPSTTSYFDYSLQADGADNPPGYIPGSNERYFNITAFYTSLKNTSFNVYGNIDTINWLDNNLCLQDKNVLKTDINKFLIGDTFITKFSHKRHHGFFKDYTSDDYDQYDENNLNILKLNYYRGHVHHVNGATDNFYFFCYGVPEYWVESSINTEYRHNAGTIETDFWPNVSTLDTWLNQSITEKNYFIDTDQSYLYNFDYSQKFNTHSFCNQLPGYNPKDICGTNYKTRVIYSEKSQVESLADNWLIYKPDNYYDFPKTKGELIDIRTLGQDKIMFRFEDTVYFYPAYETLQTNENTIQIGNGSMFDKDPKELVTVDNGYMGTRSMGAFNSTPFGMFSVDDKRGKIFQFTDKANEISNNKLFNWFFDNLTLNLIKDFPLVPVDNPQNPNGIGFLSVFDQKNNLWFLTKKDYSVLNSQKDYVFYDSSINEFFWQQGDKFIPNIQLTDKTYFCDESWTISYSPIFNRWISWYSFLPNNYIQGYKGYLSNINQYGRSKLSSIWTHNKGKFHVYYDKEFSHILEYPFTNTDSIISKLSSIEWKTYCYEVINGVNYEHKDITYDKMYVYNSEQLSGNINLIVKDTNNLSTINNYPIINSNSIDIQAYKSDGFWSISTLEDRLKDRSYAINMFTVDCNDNNIDYANSFPVDQVVNPSSVQYNKPWTDLKPFKSTWNKARFIFTNNNYSLVSNLFSESKRPSIR